MQNLEFQSYLYYHKLFISRNKSDLVIDCLTESQLLLYTIDCVLKNITLYVELLRSIHASEGKAWV